MSFLQQNWRKGQNRFCLEAWEEGVETRMRGWGTGRRNDQNNICTCELMNTFFLKIEEKVKCGESQL
jgi:hypothetical protein